MTRLAAPRVVALTGVPGTGKTTVAAWIAAHAPGVRVLRLHDLAEARGLLRERDEARGSFVVDLDDLAGAVAQAVGDAGGPVVVEGHLAHEMDADFVVLLRCEPGALAARLRARGWTEAKVRENVEAEALDVLAQDVLDAGAPAIEIDATGGSVEAVARRVLAIAEKGAEAFKGDPVGSAAWSLESLPWS